MNVDRKYIDDLRDLNANITDQDHGNIIATIGQIKAHNYDGLISSDLTDHLIVYTSDCLPIIGTNNHNQFIIHSGWKGLLHGIIDKLVQHPLIEGQYDISIGPHISMDAFNVRDDFIVKWKHVIDFENFCLNNHFNLAEFAKKRLTPITKSIEISEYCTYYDKRFASYRRNGHRNQTNLTIHNF